MDLILKFILFLFRAFLYCVLNTLFVTLILYLCGADDWKLLMIVFFLTFSLGFFLTYPLLKKLVEIVSQKHSFFQHRIVQFFLLLVFTECTWILITFTALYDTKDDVSPRFSFVDLICLLSAGFLFLLDLIRVYLNPKRLQ